MRLCRGCRAWLATPREGLLRQRFRSIQQIYEGCRDQDRGGVSRKPRNRSKGAPYGAPFPLMGVLVGAEKPLRHAVEQRERLMPQSTLERPAALLSTIPTVAASTTRCSW